MTKGTCKKEKVGIAKKCRVKIIGVAHFIEPNTDIYEMNFDQEQDESFEPLYTRKDKWFTAEEYNVFLASVKEDRRKKAEWRRINGKPEDHFSVPICDDNIWPGEI
jgi:hypothetical protein